MRNMKKKRLVTGVISALLALGGYTIGNAYTYSGVTSTVDKVAEDENDLVITNKSNLSSNNVQYPKIVSISTVKHDNVANSAVTVYEQCWAHHPITSLYEYRDLSAGDNPDDFENGSSGEGNYVYTRPVYTLPANATDNDISTANSYLGATVFTRDSVTGKVLVDTSNIKFKDYFNWSYASGFESFAEFSSYIETIKNELGDAAITVSNASSLTSKANVQTSKSINVSGTSTLSATGTITGGTITSDGDIVAASNYSAPSGKSTITAPTINATGALNASKDISATTGSVSANTIQATSGNITASNTITAGGTVKANSINAAGVNASSATITGNQSIGGIFTAAGQANLNGGAALNNKKITSLADGTLSASSNDAVNGRQLYNAMQNAGKTYTAGGDIVISSANAISVSKAGQVVSGNTGIVTGGTVYAVTSALSSTITDQGKQLTAATTSIKTINTAVENVRKSLSDLNTSNANFLSTWNSNSKKYVNKDLSNLSADGTASLKAMIKAEVQNQIASTAKTTASTSASTATLENRQSDPIVATADTATADTSYIDNAVAGKADKSDLASLSKVVDTKANKTDLDSLAEKVNTKADLSYVNDELAKKADKPTVDALAKDVKANTENIAANTEAIKANTTDIAGLKESKANVDASNIDVKAWSEKLGTGVIEKDNKELVTGGVVFDALDKKADIGYVNAGFSMMEGQMQAMNQSLIRDINRVGAGAAALAGLHPQDYDPNNKLDFAVGYGHYKNANATALGMYYRPNAGTTFSLAGTIGNGDPMLSAGLSFKLGMGKNVEKVVVTKEDFESMQAEMQAQDKKLQQMEDTLRKLMA